MSKRSKRVVDLAVERRNRQKADELATMLTRLTTVLDTVEKMRLAGATADEALAVLNMSADDLADETTATAALETEVKEATSSARKGWLLSATTALSWSRLQDGPAAATGAFSTECCLSCSRVCYLSCYLWRLGACSGATLSA